MKVLWVCNVPTEDALRYKNSRLSSSGGWLTGYINAIKSSNKKLRIVYCYPSVGQKELNSFSVEGIKYYEFYAPKKYGVISINANCNNRSERKSIRSIIEIERPDIIHIWGTEYYHSLMSIEENFLQAKVVCSIQGLTSEIAKYYLEYIPQYIYHKWSISCLIRGTLAQQRRNLMKRGKNELEIIRKCNNFIGRTSWDKAVLKTINPQCTYYDCNETMRDSFYRKKWDYNSCKINTLFFSQGSSPLKGLNIAIEALAIIKKKYPDIMLSIAGSNFTKCDSISDKIRISTYGQYIGKLIKQYDLEKHVKFLGPLTEDEMVEQYLKCNVFISSSSIENSSNSVSEAMLLGVPIISSYVGGIPSLFDDKVHGLMYQGNSPAMLADHIDEMLLMKANAASFGQRAREKGRITHDPERNNNRLIEIYEAVLGDKDGDN